MDEVQCKDGIPKIIIEIRGGCLIHIAANMDIEYVLIDHDNIAEGDNDLGIEYPDYVSTQASNSYLMSDFYGKLTELGF